MDYFVARLSADQGGIALGSIVEFDLSGGNGGIASVSSGVVTVSSAGTYYVSFNLGGDLNEGASIWELRDSGSTPITDDAGQVMRVTLADNVSTNATESPGISSVCTFAGGQTLQIEVVLMDDIVDHNAQTCTLTLLKLA